MTQYLRVEQGQLKINEINENKNYEKKMTQYLRAQQGQLKNNKIK